MPYANHKGVRTYFEVEGTGSPVLLISGNGMDHTAFSEQVEAFRPHFKCITYDLRGVGRSTVTSPNYTVGDMAEDALGLLAHMGIDRLHLAGYSLGGAIAQEMVLRRPDLASSLSLYATYDRPEPYLRLRYDLLLRVVRESTPEIWAMFTAFSAFGQSYINHHEPGVRAEIQKRVARFSDSQPPDIDGLEGHYRAILSHDTAGRLDAITCPTFIAVGSDDPVTPPYYAHRMHAAIAGSELSVFEGKPHRLLSFGAEEFTRQALDFLLRNNP